jgi:hypothetical protein
LRSRNYMRCFWRYYGFINSILWAILLSILITACSSLKTPPDYTLSFLNKSGHDLDDIGAFYDDKPWGISKFLVRGGVFTMDGLTEPIPPEVELRLVENGKHRTVKLNLKDIPKWVTNDGEVMFVINADQTVDVKAFKSIEAKERAEVIDSARKGYYRVCFVNKTGRDVEAISVSAEEAMLLNHPKLFGGAFTYSGYLSPPIPPQIKLQWKQDSAPHALEMKLANVPKGFEGMIYIIVKAEDNVEVHPIKNGDDKAAFELVK